MEGRFFEIYEKFSKLGNLALRKGKPVCESCRWKDVCCLERKEVDVVFLFPFERKFIEKRLGVKVPFKVEKTKYGKVELLKHFDSKCVFWDERKRCKIFKFAPIDCKSYPYSISWSQRKRKFFLIRYKECEIVASKRKVRELKRLFERLVEVLPEDFLRSLEELDKKIFRGKKLYEEVEELEISKKI